MSDHHLQRLLHVLHLAGEHGHGEQREAGLDVPSTGLVGIRRVRTGLVRVAMMTVRCHGCGLSAKLDLHIVMQKSTARLLVVLRPKGCGAPNAQACVR